MTLLLQFALPLDSVHAHVSGPMQLIRRQGSSESSQNHPLLLENTFPDYKQTASSGGLTLSFAQPCLSFCVPQIILIQISTCIKNPRKI